MVVGDPEPLAELAELADALHARIVEPCCARSPPSKSTLLQVLIAERDFDVTQFPTVGHFASWAGAFRQDSGSATSAGEVSRNCPTSGG